MLEKTTTPNLFLLHVCFHDYGFAQTSAFVPVFNVSIITANVAVVNCRRFIIQFGLIKKTCLVSFALISSIVVNDKHITAHYNSNTAMYPGYEAEHCNL